jgi:glyoxylase-like metal-dependent hydrolase (beta-lactamase superfamily II)
MRTHLIALSLGLACTSIAAAQTNPYTTIRLTDGVYAVVRHAVPGGAADSNVLFIVNDGDVIVVDANILPTSAREVIGEIRKVTDLPVRYVINTHWHADHHFGNAAYREAFPGVEFVQHPATRADAIARELPDIQRNVTVEYPAVIARIDRALETGRTSTGAEVTATMRDAFTHIRGLYRLFIDDMATAPMIPGTLIVSDSLVFHRGERTIVVKHLGRGNTAGDLVVHLPRERIVATGDLVVHPTPFAFFSHVEAWPGTLRTLRALDARTVLPGHGEVQQDWGYVDRLIALLEATWAEVRSAVAGGADLAATLERVTLATHRDSFGDAEGFDRLYRRPAIEAAFRTLTDTGATRR